MSAQLHLHEGAHDAAAQLGEVAGSDHLRRRRRRRRRSWVWSMTVVETVLLSNDTKLVNIQVGGTYCTYTTLNTFLLE